MRWLRAQVQARRLVVVFSAVVLVAVVSGLLLRVVGVGGSGVNANSADAYTIALAAPLTGDLAENGHEMEASLRLYVDQVNKSGGINGHAVNLLVFDDKSDPQTAPQVAQQIADSKALAVIGHFISAISLPAGPVYKRNGIPAVTGTATADPLTQDNPFYFRVTFANTVVFAQFGGYVGSALGAKRASLIYSNDTLGQTIRDGFVKGFPGTMVKTWAYDDSPDKRDASRKQILDELAQTPDPGTVMIGMIETPGSKFVLDMKRRGIRAPIVGSDSFSDPLFSALFRNEPEEKAQPGYFTEGLYAPSAFLLADANLPAQQFDLLYHQRDNLHLSEVSAPTVDALKITLAALAKAPARNTAQSKAADRLALRDALNTFKNPQNAVDGLTGPLYFDNQNNSPVPVQIGFFSHTHLIPAPTQYVAVVNPQSVDI